MTGFSQVGDVSLVAGFLSLAETLDGFGNNSAIYLRFERPLSLDRLPSIAESAQPDAALLLVNVDPNSPRRGELIPYEWAFQEEQTRWQPENLLAIRPVWGAPLESATTYAVIVTDDLARGPADFSEVWRDDHPQHDEYADIQEAFIEVQRPLADVVYAFSFTTQDATAEMARIVSAIDTWVPRPPLIEDPVIFRREGINFKVYTGQISVPMWQEGDRPYVNTGGGFAFDAEGNPTLFGWDRTTFSLTVPFGPPPEGGWPVVIYSHGTGGNHTSFVGGENSPAAVFAQEGMVGFGISQPIHGDRSDTLNVELYSFNYFNPVSGRTMFRQGALDQIFLSRVLTEQALTFTTEDGVSVPLNPERVGYVGHSHGGVVGAMAAAFFDGRIDAVVFSGAGGGLSITVIERDLDGIDIQGLITDLLAFDEDEVFNDFHPIVSLLQMNAEATDPINYAAFWHKWEAPWSNPSVSVLQTEGLLDTYTPPRTTEALAGAADIPVLTPVAQTSPILDLLDLAGEPTPAVDNLRGWDGKRISSGVAQYPEQGHFAIFRDDSAQRLYQRFLASALKDDTPEILPVFNP